MRGETHYYVFAPLDSNVVGYTSQVEHARCNRSEEHTSELQSLTNLVCRLLLEKKKNNNIDHHHSNSRFGNMNVMTAEATAVIHVVMNLSRHIDDPIRRTLSNSHDVRRRTTEVD